jgi:hypothetical protein
VDVAVATSNTVVVLRNTGNAHPNAFTALPAVATLWVPYDMAAGDVDGDGDVDVVVPAANGGSSRIQVLRNDGSGTLTRTDVAASIDGYRLVLAPLNGNGFRDVAVCNNPDSSVTVLLDPGAGCAF